MNLVAPAEPRLLSYGCAHTDQALATHDTDCRPELVAVHVDDHRWSLSSAELVDRIRRHDDPSVVAKGADRRCECGARQFWVSGHAFQSSRTAMSSVCPGCSDCSIKHAEQHRCGRRCVQCERSRQPATVHLVPHSGRSRSLRREVSVEVGSRDTAVDEEVTTCDEAAVAAHQ